MGAIGGEVTRIFVLIACKLQAPLVLSDIAAFLYNPHKVPNVLGLGAAVAERAWGLLLPSRTKNTSYNFLFLRVSM